MGECFKMPVQHYQNAFDNVYDRSGFLQLNLDNLICECLHVSAFVSTPTLTAKLDHWTQTWNACVICDTLQSALSLSCASSKVPSKYATLNQSCVYDAGPT